MEKSKMTEVYQITCALCGNEASEGENQDHAEILAKAEGFVHRPRRWLCPDCAYVKKMRTTDVEHHNKQKMGEKE
jgi:rubredoxin